MSDGRLKYSIYTTEFDEEWTAPELVSFVEQYEPVWKDWDVFRELPQFELPPAPAHFGDRPLVTLLADHSGSMRGDRAKWMAFALRMAGQALERANFAFEILGYTTCHWQGGRSAQKWRQTGQPIWPGRLNDLMHIIYQDAEGRYPDWANTLGLLGIDGLLKENIDGEALLWADQRRRAYGATFWLCVLVCDGAPVDDATIMANTDLLLPDHLAGIVQDLDRQANCHLAIFGLDEVTPDLAGELGFENHAIVDTTAHLPHELVAFLADLIAS